jgi:hypothetical protein
MGPRRRTPGAARRAGGRPGVLRIPGVRFGRGRSDEGLSGPPGRPIGIRAASVGNHG